ncbi:zinc transporter ZIP11 isoform X3 [Lagenorhynchus albirostris]|uniref:zinc transporter ZIP11 isoform X3 n=1 Tax=Lagenorhynchus albirostris TaxID=27610 RepID=UPI0028EA0042|nr:zinc transporter ZIP11 isoform X3 [Lagenorhynchus albirostris]
MLQGHSPVSQALLGTFFTWGMTAAGAALVFVFSSGQRRILDGSLGFAAGVMLAASYWSLLAPAVEMATSSGGFGALAFFPVAVGFTLGAAFVYLADLLMPHRGAAEDPQMALALNLDPALMKKSDAEGPRPFFPESELSIRIGRAGLLSDKSENGEAYQRKKAVTADLPEGPAAPGPSQGSPVPPGGSSWRRIVLLILAITIHNIPEGLAVGVGFGAVEKTASATFESASPTPFGLRAEGQLPTGWLPGCRLFPHPRRSCRVDAAAGMEPRTWLRMAPLSPEPWNAGACHPAVSKLRVNPSGFQTGR